ncbi:hypothetical protein COS54_01045 [Candidatus Shapirobacteria bacterium CG03_land_8_20_14_0_80_39_12]|uniref:Thioredoxin domain-containing protein n=1 Tax=Candidatus Shapirobacteria bacterium CG03_land_8_20_14_0_80_39_12 TaxID=1974879 RepID=A0A2M7BED9_9BACT|nr:MAG: hypothetical protein COS54_01045 [Candidatus Shapirobacteria bacterium CG03_land_8_20_14_0_80_39_12]
MKYAKDVLILILVLLAGYLGFRWTKNNLNNPPKSEKTTFSPTQTPTASPTPSYQTIIGDFLVTDKEVCLENGKSLVYFFGSSSCPHCVWEKPIAQKVFNQFKNEIAYHENFDSQKDTDVFLKYQDINPRYVPFLILGCKYVRVGAGESLSQATDSAQRETESKKLEEEALTTILCKLTNDKPASVCALIKSKLQ